jgi:hypothetical protein
VVVGMALDKHQQLLLLLALQIPEAAVVVGIPINSLQQQEAQESSLSKSTNNYGN